MGVPEKDGVHPSCSGLLPEHLQPPFHVIGVAMQEPETLPLYQYLSLLRQTVARIAVASNLLHWQIGPSSAQPCDISGHISQMENLVGFLPLDSPAHIVHISMGVREDQDFQSCHLPESSSYTGMSPI